MATLLTCTVCGGKVSSDAHSCPHCGTPNFKSASFLAEEQRKRRQEEAQKRQSALAEMDRREGYELEVYAEGEFPANWFTSIRFYGARITGYYKQLSYNDEKTYGRNEPVCIRLLPCSYKARYTYQYYPYESWTEASFTITNTTRKIYLRFEKKILSKHYKLTSVTTR